MSLARLAADLSSSQGNFASFDVSIWIWMGFLALISVLLIIDLLVVTARRSLRDFQVDGRKITVGRMVHHSP